MRETYGTIAFQYWLEEPEFFTADEIIRAGEISKERVDKEIERRIAEIDAALSDEQKAKDMASARMKGRMAALVEWQMERRRIEDEARETMKNRMSDARKDMACMGEAARIRVLEESVRRGIIQSYDKAMVEYFHLFPEKFWKLSEEMGLIAPRGAEQQERRSDEMV